MKLLTIVCILSLAGSLGCAKTASPPAAGTDSLQNTTASADASYTFANGSDVS